MEYGQIVQRSFQIAWRYKALWIFGLFAAGSSGFNIDFGQKFPPDASSASTFNPDMFTPELVFSLLALGGVLMILFLLATCISQPALVDATNRIERGSQYSFGASFSAGIDYFARSLGLWLVMAAVGIAVMAVLIGLVIIGAALAESGGGEGAGILLAVLAMIPLLIATYFFTISVGSLAQRAIVVRDVGIGDALAEGWFLVKRNIGSTIVVFLIFIGISMGFAFVSGFVFLFFNGILQTIIPPTDFGWQTYFLIALVVGLPISLILGGFSGTFFSNLYTLYYFELVDPGRSSSAAAPNASPEPTKP